MRCKGARQKAIKQLITSRKIANQEELIVLLRDMDIHTTQATLSRDMKDLHLNKVHSENGGYYYAVQRITPTEAVAQAADSAHTLQGVTSIEFSGNACVLRTKTGYASAVASVLDSIHVPGVMGTIAGDDTVLLILRQNADTDALLGAIEDVLPGISLKLVTF